MRRFYLLIGILMAALLIGCKASPQQTAEPPDTVEPTDSAATEDPDVPINNPTDPPPDQQVDQPVVQRAAPGVVVMDAIIKNPVGVSWSPDGTRIAIAIKAAVNVYDAATYQLLLTIDVEGAISSPDVLWSPDAQTLAVGMGTGNIHFFDAQTGEEHFTLPGRGADTLAMAWSPDGRWFAAGHDGERVKLYDLQSGGLPTELTVGGHELAFSPDGTRLAGMYFGAWQAEIVDVATGSVLNSFQVGAYGDSIALSPDGARIMVSYDTGETGIALFDTATGERIGDMPIMQAQSMVWSPDGRLVVGTKGYGGRARQDAVLMTADLSAAAQMTALGTPPIEAAWSPDSTRLVTLHDKEAQVITLAQMEEVATILTAAQALPALPPRAVTAALNLVKPSEPRYEPPTSVEPPTTYKGTVPFGGLMQLGVGDMYIVEASSNGQWLAVAGRSGVTVYNTESFSVAWTSRVGAVSMMKWSPDSLSIAVGLNDGVIHVLDAFHGQPLFEMTAHETMITSLEWAGSQRLLTTETNGIGLLFDLTNDAAPAALIRSDADYEEQAANWGRSFDDTRGRISPNGLLFATTYNIGSGCDTAPRFSAIKGKTELFCGCGGGPDSAVVIWDAVTGVQYRIIEPYPVLDMIWLDDQRILTISYEGKIGIHDATTGAEISITDNSSKSDWRYYSELAANSTGTLLANYDIYGGAQIFDIATGERLYNLPEGVGSVSWLPDGQSFIGFNQYERYAAIYRAADGIEIGRIEDVGLMGTVSKDGTTLYAWSGADSETLSAYDIATGDRRPVLTETPHLYGVAWSPDGLHVAAGVASDHDLNAEVMVWSTQTGEITRTFDVTLPNEYGFNQVEVAWSPDGTMLAATGINTIVWDVATGAELSRYTDMSFGLAWSPDSTQLAIGGERFIWLVDPRTGDNLFTYKEHKTNKSNYAAMIPALDWSSDGKFIASGGSDGTAQVWNVATGEAVMTFELPAGDDSGMGVSTVAFSPSGQSLAVGRAYDQTYVILDEETGIGEYQQNVPDVYVLNVSTGEVAYFLGTIYSGVGGLDWSPDGTVLALSFADPGYVFGGWLVTGANVITIWDATNGAHKYTLRGHGSEIHSVKYSPDGTRLVSTSMDGTVIIWSALNELDDAAPDGGG